MDTEAVNSGNKANGSPSVSPGPQRDQKRDSRRKNQNANGGSADSNKRENGAQKQTEKESRGKDKQYQKKAADSSPNNTAANPSNPRQRNGKQQYAKKEVSQESAPVGTQPPIGNERFDNSRALDSQSQGVVLKRDMDSAKVAESARLQSLLPTGPSTEVQAQVRRIQEAFPSQPAHVILQILQDYQYDEHRTVEYFLDSSHGDKLSTPPPSQQPWNAIVKKGMPRQSQPPPRSRGRGERGSERAPRPGASQQRGGPASSDQVHTAPQEEEESFQPEEIVTSLESAIMTQLRFIQEQTKMLNSMQQELHSITQTGGGEMEQLLNEQGHLQNRKQELHRELHHIDQRLSDIDLALQEQKRAKAERIKNLASKSQQFGFLKGKTSPGPQKFPAQ